MTTTNIKLTIEIDGRKYGLVADPPGGSSLSEIVSAIALSVSDTLYADATRVVPEKIKEEAWPVPLFDYPDPEPYVTCFDGVPSRGLNHRSANRRKTFTNAFNEIVEYRYEPRAEYTNDPGRTE